MHTRRTCCTRRGTLPGCNAASVCQSNQTSRAGKHSGMIRTTEGRREAIEICASRVDYPLSHFTALRIRFETVSTGLFLGHDASLRGATAN